MAGGLDLTAVEPLEETRALLAQAIGPERVRAGVAEEIPLPEQSVDAVFAADSFHWFDQSRAMPEIRRVLRPGGGVAILHCCRSGRAPGSRRSARCSRRPGPAHPAYPGFEGLAAGALSEENGFGPLEEITVHDDRVTRPGTRARLPRLVQLDRRPGGA